jgi:uncharacterized protein involved in exopolysaccharide biosynthesis
MNQVQNPLQRTGEDRMDMRSLVEVLIRRRWIILLVAAPVVLVAVIGTLRSTQMFRARTTVMIEMGGPQNPRFQQRSVNIDMMLSSAAEIGMSAPVAMLAAESLVDSLPAYRQRYPEYFETVESIVDLRDVIHGGANSTHVGESNLLNLNFTHPVAEFALVGAKALADAFVDFNVRSRRNSPAVEYYEEQIDRTQAEIDSLYAIRTTILDESGILGIEADTKVSITQIRGLESEYLTARTQRTGKEAELRAIEDAIAADPDFVPPVSNYQSSSLNRMKAELDSKLTKIAEMRQHYKDDSVFIERERAQLDLIRDELVRERERYLQSLRVEVARVRAIEESYRESHQRQLAGMDGYSAVSGRLEILNLQIDGLKRLLQNLQMKHGEVRMFADSDVRITDVFIIEEPTLDVPVGRGRKILYLIISVVLAISMGLVAAFFVESNDHRIYDRRRAELYLEVPVLGSLPDTTQNPRS